MTGYLVQARKVLIAFVSLGLLTAGVISAPAKADTPQRNLTIHYFRSTVDANGTAANGICASDPCGIYEGWNMWVWNTGATPDPNGTDGLQFDSSDKFGVKRTFAVGNGATNVGFLVRIGTNWSWAKSDIPDDRFIALKATGDTEVWVKQGDPVVYTSNPNDRVLRIHYNREDNKYKGWDIQTRETNAADNKAIPFSTTNDCFGRVAMIQVPEISQLTQDYILRKGGDAQNYKSRVFTATLSPKKYTDVWLNASLVGGEDVTYDEGDQTFLDLSQQDLNPNGNLVVVHYSRPIEDFKGWKMLTLADGLKQPFTAVDPGFGRLGCAYVVDVSATESIIRIENGSKVDLGFGEQPTGLGGQRTIKIQGPVTEVWLKQGYTTVWEKQQAPDPAIQSGQTLSGVVSSLARGKSAKLPMTTNAKLKVSWFVLTPFNCKIKSGKLIAKDPGTCKLNVTQKGNVAYQVFTAQYRINIK
jgi:Bacterial pullanase-associated domain